MKRTSFLKIAATTALVLLSTLFFACKKDVLNPEVNASVKNLKSFGGDISLVENPYQTEEYLSATEDPDEQRLDRQLYEIGLIARNLFKDNRLNHYIMENAGQWENDCIDLRTFREWPLVQTGEYNPETLDELERVLSVTNLTYISKNPEVYGTVEHYIPAIFVANLENADPNKTPIISAGVYVNEEFSGMEEFDDYIVVWYFDMEKKEFIEGLMNEEMALRTTHPLFIVDNASEEMTKRHKSTNRLEGATQIFYPPCSEESVKPAMRRISLSSNEYQINHRYETSGKSEFCVASSHINEHGVSHWIISPNLWYMVDKVKKEDIGKPLSKWTTFWYPVDVYSMDLVPFDCNYLFWNTFERDWAKSPKDLGKATENNCTIYLGGNMKSESDWYAYKPDFVKHYPLNLSFIFWQGSDHYANNNGYIDIWRRDW